MQVKNIKFLLEIMSAVSVDQRGERPSGSIQKPVSIMVGEYISAYKSVLHIWIGTINAEMYIQVLKQHMLSPEQRLYRECLF